MIHETNIHDYLEMIGAKPPPVKGLVVIPVVDTLEEAVDFITQDFTDTKPNHQTSKPIDN